MNGRNRVTLILCAIMLVFYASVYSVFHKIQNDKANAKWAQEEQAQFFQDYINDQQLKLEDANIELQELNKEIKKLNIENEQLKIKLKKVDVPPSKTTSISRGGSFLSFMNMGTFKVTAYSLNYESCGKNPGDDEYGITANGEHVKNWYTVAMDKSVPFGTKIYIPYFKDYPNRGMFTNVDRGGAIRGNRIDVYMQSTKQCMEFGVKQLDVYFVK